MVAEVMGTVEGGALKLDEALPFPDKTRVKLRVEPAWDVPGLAKSGKHCWPRSTSIRLSGGGGPYSREKLYDRN